MGLTPEQEERVSAVDIPEVWQKTHDHVEEHCQIFLGQSHRDLVESLFEASFSDSNVLALGPPGTAKSAAVMRFAKRIGATNKCPVPSGNGLKSTRSFNILIGKFTTPDEIKGPLNVKKLTEDGKLEHNVQGYAPTARVVFLDEVYKGSSAVLNTILQLLNERVYLQSGKLKRTNNLMIVGASNEEPQSKELGAFHDRFHIKLVMEEISQVNDILGMCGVANDTQAKNESNWTPVKPLTLTEIIAIRRYIANAVTVKKDVIEALFELKNKMSHELGYSFSDRTFVKLAGDSSQGRKVASLFKVAAFLAGDNEVQLAHMPTMLRKTLWLSVESQSDVNRMIASVIKDPLSILKEMYKDISDKLSEMNSCTDMTQEIGIITTMMELKDKMSNYIKGQSFNETQAKQSYAIIAQACNAIEQSSAIHSEHIRNRNK